MLKLPQLFMLLPCFQCIYFPELTDKHPNRNSKDDGIGNQSAKLQLPAVYPVLKGRTKGLFF